MSVSTSILSPNITSTSPASTSCVSAMPGKNGYVPPTACNALYGYYPSFAAAIIFGLLFGIATVAHLIQAISYRKVIQVCSFNDCNRCRRHLILEILLGHNNGCILGNCRLRVAHFGDQAPAKCCLCHSLTNISAVSAPLCA
jgi:hypothetical protein